MMEQGGIQLGWPSAMLSPNARIHWGAKSRATKAARAEGFYATKAAKVGIAAGDVPIMVHLTFYPPDRRQRDQDGMLASCKAFLDGVADALGVNDNAFRLAAPTIAEPVKGGKVVVMIGNRNVEESRGSPLGQPPAIHKGPDIAFPESGGA